MHCIIAPTHISREAAVRSTISALLSISEPIPENPDSISDLLMHFATCHAQAVFGARIDSTSHWPNLFCPNITHCVLCNRELASPTHPPGSNGKSYLLTKTQLCSVTAKIKRCTNQQCMARYSYSTWREGKILRSCKCIGTV